jgi:hypothetical protein
MRTSESVGDIDVGRGGKEQADGGLVALRSGEMLRRL